MGRKDPVNLYYSFALTLVIRCVAEAGGIEVATPVVMEPLLKCGPLVVWVLTCFKARTALGG